MALPRFHRKIAGGQPDSTVPIKDIAVLVPLFATSLAISWEVGRFQPTGGFLSFSLSEHLLAATQALPTALLFSVFFTVLSLLFTTSARRPTKPLGKLGKVAVAAACIGTLGLVAYDIQQRSPRPHEMFIWASFAALIAIVFGSYWLRQQLWSSGIMLVFLAPTLIFIALTAGASQTHFLLDKIKSGEAKDRIATIVSKNETSKGYLLMMGEHRLMVYFPNDNRISLQKMDEVQRIDWPK